MTTKAIHKAIFKEAMDYLAGTADVEAVRRHMDIGQSTRFKSYPPLYRRMLISLSNTQGMPNSIGPIDNLREVLYDFKPAAVVEAYDSWERLFSRVKAEVKPPGRMVRKNPRTYWVQFCKSALDGAAFLTRLGSLRRFEEFVDAFYRSEDTKPALPLLLAEEIGGFGFPLACDFLKESGYTDYAKPDVHTITITKALGLSDGEALSTYRALVAMAKDVGETPYAVDKALWLIGSGNLYLDDVEFETSRVQFIRQARRALKAKGLWT